MKTSKRTYSSLVTFPSDLTAKLGTEMPAGCDSVGADQSGRNLRRKAKDKQSFNAEKSVF